MRPWCDQERTNGTVVCGPMPGWVEQLRVRVLRVRRVFCGRSAKSVPEAPESGIASSGQVCVRARRCSSRARISGRNSLRERLRGRDHQVAQLTEPGPFRVDCPLPSGHRGLQRLAVRRRRVA